MRAMHPYGVRDVEKLLRLPKSTIRALVDAGFVAPARGPRRELRFSFQDLLLLRKAEGLVSQRISPHRVRRALKKLRERLTDEQPLTGVSLGTDGPQVVVHERGARWQAESGQVLFTFEKQELTDSGAVPLVALPTRPTAGERPTGDVVPPTVEEIYELACDLDEADPERAESSYRQVIAQAPQHADAHINLGRILHERGDLTAAEEHYRRALAIRPNDPTASFNLGVVLEDAGHHADALDAYRRAIGADERNADAHYNAARLYDLLGDYASALRHLRICRDLARRQR